MTRPGLRFPDGFVWGTATAAEPDQVAHRV